MGNSCDIADSDILWKQYALHVDLYKFYLDLAVKINVFYYAITGAILAYYFQHIDDGITHYSLLLPILFSMGIGGIFFYGASLLNVTRKELFAIRDMFKLQSAPEIGILAVLLRVLGAVMVIVGVTLAIFFIGQF